jgi:hypothetical protein
MGLLCIDIQRHDAGIYGWIIAHGPDLVCGDDGDSSISDCINNAACTLPEGERLAEVRYRGIHMGTFVKKQLIEFPDLVADRIMESYGTLIAGI